MKVNFVLCAIALGVAGFSDAALAGQESQQELNCIQSFRCTRQTHYVCGSDHRTYKNECLLRRAICKNQQLTKAHDGKCCDKPCTKELHEVCGNDGKTYGNPCLFNNAKCANPGLTKVRDGPCQSACDNQACTLELHEVCGSDGKTYPNPCVLRIEKCKNPKLTQVYEGPCQSACDKPCTKELNQVCGSDGNTYGNPCLFNNAKCANPGLTKVRDGACVTTTKSCASLQCPTHSKCVQEANQVYCADVCDKGRCNPNETCQLVQVQCITTPCPQIAKCTRAKQ